jgi:hypothetical protein
MLLLRGAGCVIRFGPSLTLSQPGAGFGSFALSLFAILLDQSCFSAKGLFDIVN